MPLLGSDNSECRFCSRWSVLESSVGMVMRLRAWRSGVRVSVAERVFLQNVLIGSGAHPAFLWRLSGLEVQPPAPPHAFVVWAGTTGIYGQHLCPLIITKHIGFTSRFQSPEEWRHARSLLRTHNSGVTCWTPTAVWLFLLGASESIHISALKGENCSNYAEDVGRDVWKFVFVTTRPSTVVHPCEWRTGRCF